MDTMDTVTDDEVKATTDRIKAQMPETYRSIQAKAKEIGKGAFGLVRRSIKGEANCFWACERGIVVGTPFNEGEIARDVAQLMVQFGSTFVCIWAKSTTGGASGAN